MRAWQVQTAGEPAEVLRQVDIPPPEPGPGQVRLRVTAAGIGLPDVLMCRGVYPLTPPLPFTPGQELAGVVTALGENVDLEIGTRLMTTSCFTEGHGSFAEECTAIAAHAFPVPDALDDESAAGFWIPHMTGWMGLVDRAGLQRGDVLVVLGAAGGSGIAAVQLGKALGAQVIAVVSDEVKATLCDELGADATIVTSQLTTTIADALRKETDGRGVDVIYDPVGGEAAEDAFHALTMDGRLLAIGFASGRWPQIPAHEFVITNTSLVGVIAGGRSREHQDDIHRRLADLIEAGTLRTAISEKVPFEELPDALQRLGTRSVIGKMVMLAP